MLTELVFNLFISDNFSTELVKECENNHWKDNLDRQQQRRREAEAGYGKLCVCF